MTNEQLIDAARTPTKDKRMRSTTDKIKRGVAFLMIYSLAVGNLSEFQNPYVYHVSTARSLGDELEYDTRRSYRLKENGQADAGEHTRHHTVLVSTKS